MRRVFDAAGLRVFDDVLLEAEFQALRRWAEQLTYRGVHHGQWRTVWRLGEGEPLRGPTWLASAGSARSQEVPPDLPPALEPLAALLRRLLLDGRQDAARVSMTPWIYPQGTALGLHRDDGQFDGSYIFYSVAEWDVHWGGLLHCVADPPDAAVPARGILDITEERDSVGSVGPGLWVSPARNRLVTLAPHLRHFISRVDPNAGDRPRTSIGGFIHRSSRT
ncbi:hypothetical protein [Jatrophihabitans sp.]|jgi:hypothetical protein|uniref:hypothetical protein n=1 Tax=Jatrophihabitans sp. TaxID=1932789 RepID=UPI002EECBB7A